MKHIGKRAVLLLALIVASGCAATAGRPVLPYDSWRLGFIAPTNMEVWIETADVEDVRGIIFKRAGSGTVSIAYRKDAAGGWPKRPGMGAGRQVTGAALPKRIFVRWQSLVEPQTYRVILEVPEHARRLMLSRELQPQYMPEHRWEYRENLVVGLAPGGIAKVWIKGPGLEAIEVLCQRAEIEPRGPDLGQYGGRYVTLPAEPQRYLRAHPVPYDSWKCPSVTPGTASRDSGV